MKKLRTLAGAVVQGRDDNDSQRESMVKTQDARDAIEALLGQAGACHTHSVIRLLDEMEIGELDVLAMRRRV